MPGSFRSSRYFAAPVIMRGSSTRFMRAPSTLVVCVSSTWVVMAPPHRRRVDGLDDVLVAGAAADVALEPAPDLRLGEPVAVRAEELDAGHDHPRGAEATLERVVLPEGLLERMELAALRETLDRLELAAVGLDREHGARLHRVTVQVDRAGAAQGRVAADLRPGEPKVVAEEVHEQRPRLDLRLVPDAVDGECYRYHQSSSRTSAAWNLRRQPGPQKPQIGSVTYSCTDDRLPLSPRSMIRPCGRGYASSLAIATSYDGRVRFGSVEEVERALAAESYLPDRGLATAIYLTVAMQRPLLLEGEAGVGKTEVGKTLARVLGAELIRLQCYE